LPHDPVKAMSEAYESLLDKALHKVAVVLNDKFSPPYTMGFLGHPLIIIYGGIRDECTNSYRHREETCRRR
jgi:hypothetical protein